MAITCHGAPAWCELAAFFAGRFKKSQQRMDFVQARLLRDLILWEDVRERVWPRDERRQNSNRFAFLQGDLVRTRSAASREETGRRRLVALGIDPTKHESWMIASTDCSPRPAVLLEDLVQECAVVPRTRGRGP